MDFYRPIRFFKNIWWFLIINFIWGTLASIYYNETALDSIEEFWLGALIGFAISATYVYGFALIWFELDKKYSWIDQTGKRILFGLLLGGIYAVLSVVIVVFVSGLFLGKGDISVSIAMISNSWVYPAANFIPTVLIVCTFAFFKKWSNSVANGEKLKAEMMTYKFESLQNQLNPHFLFNSFNVLSNLVYEDQKLAVKFVDQLGEIYNYVLDNKENHLVSLKAELTFIDSYYFLLKTRFEEKIELEININVNSDCQVAPMVLQLLIENAVKHNVITKQSPLKITIENDDRYLHISNPLNPKKVHESSTQTGLKNIQQRYGLLTSLPVLVEKSETFFRVSIPMIKKEVAHEVA